jgi:hypothetical protein
MGPLVTLLGPRIGGVNGGLDTLSVQAGNDVFNIRDKVAVACSSNPQPCNFAALFITVHSGDACDVPFCCEVQSVVSVIR